MKIGQIVFSVEKKSRYLYNVVEGMVIGFDEENCVLWISKSVNCITVLKENCFDTREAAEQRRKEIEK